MSADARNTRASPDANRMNGPGSSLTSLLNDTVGLLRSELRAIDRAIAALIRFSDGRRANGVIEIRPPIVAVKRTARSLKGR
jgi:hypothetical protein